MTDEQVIHAIRMIVQEHCGISNDDTLEAVRLLVRGHDVNEVIIVFGMMKEYVYLQADRSHMVREAEKALLKAEHDLKIAEKNGHDAHQRFGSLVAEMRKQNSAGKTGKSFVLDEDENLDFELPLRHVLS